MNFAEIIEDGPKTSRKVQMELEINKYIDDAWTMLTNPLNYLTEHSYQNILDFLVKLEDSGLYYRYADYLASKKDLPSRLQQFNDRYRIYEGLSELDAYICVAAYVFAKCEAMRKTIKRMFGVYYNDAIKHERVRLCNVKNCSFDLTEEELPYYRMCYCLLKERDNNKKIANDFGKAVCSSFYKLNRYISILDTKIDKSTTYVDAFYAPFLLVYKRGFKLGINSGRIIETLIVLKELILYHNYRIHRDDILFCCHLFFVSYESTEYIFDQDSGYELYEYIESSVEKKAEEVKNITDFCGVNGFFDCLIASSTFDGNREVFVRVLDYLDKCTKKQISSLLRSYIGHRYLREDPFKEGNTQTEYLNYVKETIDTVTDNYIMSITQREVKATYKLLNAIDYWKNYFSFVCVKANKEKRLKGSYAIVRKSDTQKVDTPREQKKIIKSLTEENAELKRKVSHNKEAFSELCSAKKEIENLKNQLTEQEKDRKELISLRNFLYQCECTSDIQETKMDIDDMGSFLNKNIRGVIMGGHVNFHNKLQKYIPSWKFYPVRQNVPVDVIQNADLVVICTDHIDHSSYLASIGTIRNSNCKLLYLHNVNLEHVIQEIFDYCKE